MAESHAGLTQGCRTVSGVGRSTAGRLPGRRVTDDRDQRSGHDGSRTPSSLLDRDQPLVAALDAGGIGLAHIDPDSRRLLDANAAFCVLSGYAADELRGLPLDRLNHPDDPFDERVFAALLARGSASGRQRRIVRRDGAVRWVQLSAQVLRGEGGRAESVLAIVQDITEARRAREALLVRERHLGFIMRLNDTLRRLDDPVALSFEAARLLGEFAGADRVGYAEDAGDGESVSVTRNYTRGVPGIEGRYRYDDYGPALLRAFRAGRTVVRPDIARDPALTDEEKAAHAALALGATVNIPLLKDGRLHAVFFVHAREARAWTNADVALFRDVAERLRADLERARAEAVLRTTRGWLAAALAGMTDAVLIVDNQAHAVAANEAHTRLLGLRPATDLHADPANWQHDAELQLAEGSPVADDQWPARRALRGERGAGEEHLVVLRDTGERRNALISYAPIQGEQAAIAGAVITARDITGFKRMHAELETAHGDLQRLLAALDSARDAERLRIARELHDDLQQGLVAMMLEAGAARLSLGRDRPDVRESLARIDHQARGLIASTRRIIRDLRPLVIEELGLVAALESLALHLPELGGPVCTVDTRSLTSDDEERLSPMASSLYRLAQEALTNVAKHARARQAQLVLASDAPGFVRLTITDDGVGMPLPAPARTEGFGLAGMRERVRGAGGTLTIRDGTPQGTIVTVQLPLPAPAAAGDKGGA